MSTVDPIDAYVEDSEPCADEHGANPHACSAPAHADYVGAGRRPHDAALPAADAAASSGRSPGTRSCARRSCRCSTRTSSRRRRGSASTTSATVLNDPLLPKAVENTAEFAGLALIFGYPMPLVAAVLMSEVRRFRGLYSALAYLPGGDPAGGRRAALEDVLRREPDRRLQHDPRLGAPRAVPVAAVAADRAAVARARVDVGERRRHGDHLSRGADRREPRALRSGVRRRRVALAQGLAHHDARSCAACCC